jgi:hypothetical protein
VQREARQKLVIASLVACALVIAAQSAAHLVATVGFGACDGTGFAPCPSPFDLDRSNGVGDVISTAVIGAAALGALALGVGGRRRDPVAVILAAFLFLAMVDDGLHLEDDLRTVRGLIVTGTILCAALISIRVAFSVPDRARLLLLLGVVLLLADVKMPFLYDPLMNTVGQPALVRGDFLYELGVVLDEGLELAGWMLLAVGLWDAALGVVPRGTVIAPRGSGTGPDPADGRRAQLGVGTTSPTSASRATSDA